MAILHVSQVLKRKELEKLSIIICSDSVEAINFFREGCEKSRRYRLIFLTCDVFLDLDLKDLESKLCYVQRELNQSADELAKKGLDKPYLSIF